MIGGARPVKLKSGLPGVARKVSDGNLRTPFRLVRDHIDELIGAAR